jgi:nicotinamidase/pyrazinamidase
MSKALIVVDVQNDFCEGGSLPVPGAAGIVAPCNELLARLGLSVLTQDWHPEGHCSFGVWPVHCAAGTYGASFHTWLKTERARLVLRKGTDPAADCMSAFADERGRPTGLAGYLHYNGVDEVVVCGLALDFCVLQTALGARDVGLRATVVTDACAAVTEAGGRDALARMDARGVRLLRMSTVEALL